MSRRTKYARISIPPGSHAESVENGWSVYRRAQMKVPTMLGVCTHLDVFFYTRTPIEVPDGYEINTQDVFTILRLKEQPQPLFSPRMRIHAYAQGPLELAPADEPYEDLQEHMERLRGYERFILQPGELPFWEEIAEAEKDSGPVAKYRVVDGEIVEVPVE